MNGLPYVSHSFRTATPEMIERATDGCGPSMKTKFLNMIMRIDVKPACIVHDFEYFYRTMPKSVADINFYRNLIFLIHRSDSSEWQKFIARQVAYIYYLAVHLFGNVNWNR